MRDENLSRAMAAARTWLENYKERADHAMEYWAYEEDAKLFAQFILTGEYPVSREQPEVQP